MSRFHSMVSRRDFMKAVGLAGAGLGASAAISPVFHDVDEFMSSPTAEWKRPWYVKNRELEDPTVELDWSLMYRSDGIWTGQNNPTQDFFLGAEEGAKRRAAAAAYSANAVKTNQSGMTLRDRALSSGNYMYPITFMGPASSTTPESLGVPKWQGTPEENSKMIRAAMIHFGAAQVGMAEITDRVKTKLVREYDKDFTHKKYMFEDVPKGYEGTDKLVFPDKVPLYDFAFTHPLNKEMFRSSPSSDIGSAGNSLRYSQFSIIQPRIQMFMQVLGYTCYGYTRPFNGAIPTIATATLTGLGEGARNNGAFISPEFGPCVGLFSLVTDLPLEPTPPIDAGMWRFCQTCTKCADECPAQCISFEHEPTWDVPKIYGKEDTTHIPGRKQFWTDGIACWSYKATIGGCGACMGTCTFNTDIANIHTIVRATLSTTPVFNSFLWQADKFFGYGVHEDKEAWWDMSQPTLGFDTAHVTVGKDY
ncbi:reductive dehalogenase [Dehalococcoides mccartyi]|uniref:Reductive dehalogenase n=2 Tax=Bacteria TaxID=2 RepID=A0A142VBV9_9CHLR|nr:reductive dehalogenase [Dehalococcoides mccartyi]AII61530.1 dehalogenase [Dehalococcoides mccartyi CG5]AMU87323.1 reductive dehalogenase [Dehalococcoides mccartyi]MBA2084310.1 reductive dehalogenase [Dehalococcoides mccartyi]QBX64530.1 reductive dehalogenase [Dehalococcoides mccartyi]BCT56538.1 reductive dehalogenase NIT01rdhA16 [Dehalococcoides mccartyi]